MNDQVLTPLKIMVERVVRPLHASTPRKLKMREELLAHVSAVFEEECGRLGAEAAALERTAQRLGNAAELTRQLQASVPTSDGCARFLESLFVGPGWLIAFALGPAAFLGIAFWLQGRLAEWPIMVAWPVATLVTLYLVNGLRNALFGPKGRSWRKVAAISIASWFLVPGFTFALCLVFSGNLRASLLNVVPLWPLALLTPTALISPACIVAVDARVVQEWANLPVE